MSAYTTLIPSSITHGYLEYKRIFSVSGQFFVCVYARSLKEVEKPRGIIFDIYTALMSLDTQENNQYKL